MVPFYTHLPTVIEEPSRFQHPPVVEQAGLVYFVHYDIARWQSYEYEQLHILSGTLEEKIEIRTTASTPLNAWRENIRTKIY